MNRLLCILLGSFVVFLSVIPLSRGLKDADSTLVPIGAALFLIGCGLIWFGWKGHRMWARMTQAERWVDDDLVVIADPRFRCPRCRAERVFPLPPNFISPLPAYECRDCEKKMRGPGTFLVFATTATIGAVVTLGIAIVAGRNEVEAGKIYESGKFAIFGAIVFSYSLMQLFRPAPELRPDSEIDLPSIPE